MKILHTSDWHIGRTFHQHPTADALAPVLDALIDLVRDHEVDVVVVAGDVFDSSTPSAAAVEELDRVLLALRGTGATVIVTSGNHDSPARLGAKAAFARESGVHIVTRPEDHATPITVGDEHGPVHFYGIAYLEPALIRHRWPEHRLTNQASAVGFALDNIRADLAGRESDRSVVLAHTFVSGAQGDSCESERGITVGGVDRVPKSAFDGITYAALGHIHGRSTLAPHVRYSGAPLHLSFSEQDKPRGAWLVTLDADGLGPVEWLDLPVPRPLATITGTLDQLLADPALEVHEQHWVRAILTDVSRPLDPMRRLQRRFEHCAVLDFRPSDVDVRATPADPERLAAMTDQQIMAEFLAFVRNGEGPTEDEEAILDDLVSEVAGAEASR
ncbi:exonuclease SbcCD subunit D [Aeromicrobium sp.]|uniref:exonuclease SbcCD subunit D n=1 Tax=Aeromicrobium sp. TaxID=1871063 RepID=UPI0028AB6599|nr:exonuclease SbcCD subunit D [Aeromicrobium sp.]